MHEKNHAQTFGRIAPSLRLLDAVQKIDVHDHLCMIYENQAEQFRAAIPFIRFGLERGERCIYVCDENTADQIKEAMKQDGIEVERQIKRGALVIETKKGTYLRNGYFDPDEMIAFLKTATNTAKNEGFTALRVTGEMTWVLGGDPGSEKVIEYEAKLNRFFPIEDCLALCQYARTRFSEEILTDVLHTHPLVIVGESVCKNFYYVPVEEFLSKRKTSDLDRLLKNLLDREQADVLLQERTDFLNETQHLTKTGGWEFNLETETMLWTDEVYRIHGVTKAFDPNHIEKNVSFYAPKDQKIIDEAFHRAATIGEPYDLQLQFITAEGEMRWVETIGRPVMQNGKVVKVGGYIMDITARKQIEQTLLEKTKIFETFFENAETQFVLLDHKFNFVRVNKTYAKACKREVSEFAGHNHFELYPSDAKSIFEEVVKTKRSFQTKARPFVFPDEPDRVTYWDWTLTPILNNEHEVELLVFALNDVTEVIQTTEKIKKMMNVRGKFLDIISHQLRTPLTSILWSLEMLLKGDAGKVEATQKRFLETTYQASRKINDRLNDLLIAMDIEEGRVLLETEEISLDSLVTSCVIEEKNNAALKGIALTTHIPEACLTVEGDAHKLRSIITKIIDNALMYNKTGGYVEISLAQVDHFALFKVVDSGIGIPSHEQSRVFERFFRGSNAFTMETDAFGLSLSIAKYFIEQHHGMIGFTSQEGKGSEFWFKIPLKHKT